MNDDDLIDLLQPDTTLELLGLGLVVLVVLGALVVLVYIATKLRSVSAGQGRVEAQFANNGGSTLKDSVDRLETALDAHIAESAELRAEVFRKLDSDAQPLG